MQISIIIPVYNVAAYIEDCLISIIQQDFSEAYEVIMIDDCSTDRSAEICRSFSQSNPDIFRFVSNEMNQGVSASRNRGLELCCGEYFMFVDPDDLLPGSALAGLYGAACKHDAAIVKGNNTIFNEHSEKPAAYNVNHTLVLRDESVLSTFYQHQVVRGHPWGKLFRKELLGQVRFPIGVRMAQDLLYCSEVFSLATVLVLIDDIVYHYRLRDNGSTGIKFASKSYLDWLGAVERSGEFAQSAKQRRAFRGLQLRTLTQLARECRRLPTNSRPTVVADIKSYAVRWRIGFITVLIDSHMSIRSVIRWVKLKLAMRENE